MKTKSKVLILLALIVMSSILKAQSVQCFVLLPPQNYLPSVHKIAIMNFENFDKNEYYNTFGGTAFPDYLSASFFDNSRGVYDIVGVFTSKKGASYINCNNINQIQIIEREQLNKVLSEKNLGSNVTLNDNQAAEIGKVLGIDALLTGTIRYTYKSNRTSLTYQNGSVAYFTENRCDAEVTIKVVSVSNAQIITTKSFTAAYSDKKGGSDEGNVSTFNQLAPLCLKSIATQISTYLLPSYVLYKTEFGKIKVAEFKDKVNNIKSYLEAGDLRSAYSVYKAIYDADNYNAIAAANIGELYFITGDYEETAKWYDIAAQIDSKVYAKSNETAKKWAGYAKTIKDYGVVIEKYNFSTSSDALADKVKTKGSKSDRFEVFEKTDKNSTVLAKVPGETEFIILEKSGDFVKIKLLGGKEGYIGTESLKK